MSDVLPLSEFPPEVRARIDRAVAADKPPPRWRRVELGMIPSRAWLEWHLARGYDPRQKRPKLPTWIVERVIARDGNECGICGDPVEEPPHIDHVHPRARGGKDQPGNLQIAHPKCNIAKGVRTA